MVVTDDTADTTDPAVTGGGALWLLDVPIPELDVTHAVVTPDTVEVVFDCAVYGWLGAVVDVPTATADAGVTDLLDSIPCDVTFFGAAGLSLAVGVGMAGADPGRRLGAPTDVTGGVTEEVENVCETMTGRRMVGGKGPGGATMVTIVGRGTGIAVIRPLLTVDTALVRVGVARVPPSVTMETVIWRFCRGEADTGVEVATGFVVSAALA